MDGVICFGVERVSAAASGWGAGRGSVVPPAGSWAHPKLGGHPSSAHPARTARCRGGELVHEIGRRPYTEKTVG